MTAAGGIGALTLTRKEARAFSPEEIALVETFAAQAVIAIENAQQFRELQTRLLREGATREILEVISTSRDDEGPVFEAILANTARLCAAPHAALLLVTGDGLSFRRAAEWGRWVDPDGTLRLWPVDGPLPIAQSIRERRTVTLDDMQQSAAYLARDPTYVHMVEVEGLRTRAIVPLIHGDRAIGAISLSRHEARPFTPGEIALVETFAAQAVIAIENVRQFRELQVRLERERASAEILELISRSRDDDRPVFDLIVQKAAQLCDAPVCTLWRVENGIVHYCASHGLHGEGLVEAELTPPEPLADNTMTAQVVRARAVARIEDATDESYLDHEWARARGLKYMVGVPIFIDGEVWGSIHPMWPPERSPREDDIQLVESFAAQAAIAIENVRQFRALEALNAELGDRVREQVGEIERMGRLKRFLPAAVADAVVSSGSERMLQSHRALLGVLFCDIRGFTAFCERAEPEETIEVLQTYHEEMGRLIEAHGAGVDHRMGDGIMVLFNDPVPCDDPAGQAVRLALAMRARMAELCARWKRMGHRLGFGVGIALGYATVGMVGSGGRQDYTASGTAVNLAERLCGEARDGEILLAPRAAAAVGDGFPCESRGEHSLKGIREPVEVFVLSAPTA
jgi:class 3 adenylate cyclase